jgi:Fe2+ or Zn2+ uptake regulation protein
VSDAARERSGAIRDAILAYLLKHPRASDSVTGICSWWLREEGVEEERTVVEGVLEELAGARLIRRFELPDGTIVFASVEHDRRGA